MATAAVAEPLTSFRRDFKEDPIPEIPDDALANLSRYTGEKDLNVLRQHVVDLVQDVKRTQHVYGCISNILFLDPRVQVHPYYETFIAAQTPTTRTLEVGVCFGTDLRRYVQDGVNPASVTVADLHDGYWQLGGRLYGDEGKNGKIQGVKTVFGDFAAVDGAPRAVDLRKEGLEEQFDFIVNILVLHVFSKPEGRRFLTRLFNSLKSGGTLFGQCGGSTHEGPWDSQNIGGTEVRWRHSAASLKQLLEEIGFVDVQTVEQPHGTDRKHQKAWKDLTFGDDTSRSLIFIAKRA
ncbi:hypothetical protein HDV00_005253 [Rhizophlyctis rosea]|nr:hypothetical protein HDV00_005253 [Rhizophlyctis rosea]